MLDLLDDGGELALHPAIEACAEDLGDLGGGEPPQADLAAALEELISPLTNRAGAESMHVGVVQFET